MNPRQSEGLAQVELRRALDRVLVESGAARLDAILESSAPRAITQAMAPVEAFYTFASLEEEGRRALLILLSDEQLDHLLDLDMWSGDELDAERALDWLERLWGADQDLAVAWLLRADGELVTTVLQLLCTVTEGPSSQESLTEKSDLLPPFTAEGVYYVDFHSERAAALLRGPLILLAGADIERYLAHMGNVILAVRAEVAETALSQRWNRLRDEGLVPPDEAYEIYRWPTAQEIKELERDVAVEQTPIVIGDDDAAPTALAQVGPAGPLAEAVALLGADHLRRLAREAVMLSGRVLSADHLPLSDLDAHRGALEKTLGYVAIGLRRAGREEPVKAAETLAHCGAMPLFRFGAATVADLGRRAVSLRRRGWLTQMGLGLEVLDDPLSDVVHALARPRPVYPAQALDGATTNRDFRSADEVDQCSFLLGRVEMLGRLFIDGLGLDLASADIFNLEGCTPDTETELTLGLIFRTAIATSILGGGLRYAPIEADQLAALVEGIRALEEDESAQQLQRLLAERLDVPEADDLSHLRDFVEENLASLRSSIAGIDLSQPVDPRFVGAVIVRDARR